jgi:NADPH:quinone reductase-like Zn-dependent oxidoreductase
MATFWGRMKAVVQRAYGAPDEVLAVQEVDRPAIGDNDVLVRVRAASVHVDVWHVVTGRPYLLRLAGNGLRKPKRRVPGTDLAGVVEAVGKAVTRFGPGAAVFGDVAPHPWTNGGTFAEYAAAPEDCLALMPDRVTFEQAASVPAPGTIALLNLRNAGRLKAGQNVLINGAGGGVGSFAVQIAKADGARVTGVDCAEKLSMIRGLGADHAIDFAREDFTQSGERYDLILDVASTLSLDDCRRVLTSNGIYVFIGHDHFGKASGRILGSLPRFLGLGLRGCFDNNLPKPSGTKTSRQETMTALKVLLESGKLTPIVARTFQLSDVPEAMRTLQEGRTLGRIVIAP